MSYYVEFAQSLYEAFYQEVAMIDVESGEPLPCAGVDHQFKVFGETCDYGNWISFGQVIASNSGGGITATTAPNVFAINVPPGGFFGPPPSDAVDIGPCLFPMDLRRSWRCALLAVPADPTQTKVIFTGKISFGDRTMNPRLTMKAYPLYPVPVVPSPTATQVKIQLNTMAQLNTVEAALPANPVDPATLTWTTGGIVSVGGALYNIIANALSWNSTAMAIFLSAAAAQQT